MNEQTNGQAKIKVLMAIFNPVSILAAPACGEIVYLLMERWCTYIYITYNLIAPILSRRGTYQVVRTSLLTFPLSVRNNQHEVSLPYVLPALRSMAFSLLSPTRWISRVGPPPRPVGQDGERGLPGEEVGAREPAWVGGAREPAGVDGARESAGVGGAGEPAGMGGLWG